MDEPTIAEIRECIDRQKCYDVLTRYCRALDRCDLPLMRTVYWPDAIDEHGIFTGNAREFAGFIIDGIRKWFEMTTHAICNVHMEYHGDVMCTESYLLAYSKVNGRRPLVEEILGSGYLQQFAWDEVRDRHHVFFLGGRYIDRLERRDGEWRIALRRVVMDWNENFPGRSVLDEGMPAGLTLRGLRSRRDPVYANRPGPGRTRSGGTRGTGRR